MAIAIPILRFLLLASLVLAEGAHTAQAGTVNAKLRVSAELLVTCRLDASVPRVGTPGRDRGAARFGVTCTQGAVAVAVACSEPCGETQIPAQRTEHRLDVSRGDGATIATVLF